MYRAVYSISLGILAGDVAFALILFHLFFVASDSLTYGEICTANIMIPGACGKCTKASIENKADLIELKGSLKG